MYELKSKIAPAHVKNRLRHFIFPHIFSPRSLANPYFIRHLFANLSIVNYYKRGKASNER